MTIRESDHFFAQSYITSFKLDDLVWFKLRLDNQRHLVFFSRHLPEVTPTQFSILVRLCEVGEVSQNQLGRLVAIDAATTKGVISRLIDRGLVQSRQDGRDLRRLQISLTNEGHGVVRAAIEKARAITEETTDGAIRTDGLYQLDFMIIRIRNQCDVRTAVRTCT